MAKTRKVEKIAIVLPNGTKSDIDQSLVDKYSLSPGKLSPFSRASTTQVLRTEQEKSGPKDWSPEDDAYLLEHWETMTRAELGRRLNASATSLRKRHSLLTETKTKTKKRRTKKSR